MKQQQQQQHHRHSDTAQRRGRGRHLIAGIIILSQNTVVAVGVQRTKHVDGREKKLSDRWTGIRLLIIIIIII